MSRRKHTAEQIISKLRQGLSNAAKELDTTEQAGAAQAIREWLTREGFING
ncbi:unnamed protein product [marine sediment metagenome]|uniref:Uncharacterized protein n=1 Tax=marine sediment metagenome TaxID=412755 RepID=X0SP96_9ZZZZ